MRVCARNYLRVAAKLRPIGFIAAACVFGSDALAQSPPPSAAASSPIGVWRGTSTCLVRPSPCKDEVVIYRFAAKDMADSVSLDARKIVHGEEEEMGILACHVARATGKVTCTIPQGIWRFTTLADTLFGELRLTDGTRFRDVRAIRFR